MQMSVKSVLAGLVALLGFSLVLYLAVCYLVSFYKIFSIVFLLIGLSHVLAGIFLKKR